jgi:hypothetical protein
MDWLLLFFIEGTDMNAPDGRANPCKCIPFLLTLSGVIFTTSMPASAQLSPALDRFSVTVGAFQADPKFNGNVNTPLGSLASGDVNLGTEIMPRMRADLLIFDSQGLHFDYYQYNHTYSGAFANNANVNGLALTTVGNASLNFKVDFAKMAYRWWFGSGNTVLGLGAGAAYYNLDLSANATASVNSSTTVANGSYSDDALAPLLEIGVRHAIGPDFRIYADATGVKKLNGALTGEIYNTALGLEWFPAKNVGVVLEYGKSQINLSRNDSMSENFKINFQGPSAFVKLRY